MQIPSDKSLFCLLRFARHSKPTFRNNVFLNLRRTAADDEPKLKHVSPLPRAVAAQIGAVVVENAKLRSEEHTSELQSLMRISYAVFCLKKNKTKAHTRNNSNTIKNVKDKS